MVPPPRPQLIQPLFHLQLPQSVIPQVVPFSVLYEFLLLPVLPLVPDGVGLYLDGNQLVNNSLVNLADIGEGDCALICYTNSPDCCVPPVKDGEWYFPNRSAVSIQGEMKDFYRDREGMTVRLNRRNNAMSPTGIYCCDIPGSDGDICIELYILKDGIYNNINNVFL